MTTQATDAGLMQALGAKAADPAAGAGTGAGASPTSGQPAPGAGNAGNPPPATGQPGDTTGAATAGASAPPAESEADKIAKQIRGSLGLKEKEPDTVEYWRGKHAESSKEAKRLAKALKDREARLAQTGLKFLESESGVELAPGENFQETVKLEKGLGSKILKSLKGEEKDLLVENPEEYANLIAQRAVETYLASRPAPTAKEAFVKMSEEDINAAHDEIVQRKGADGKPILKDYETFEPYIKAMLEDSVVPKDFVRFMKSSPANYEFGLKSLYNIVAQSAAPLIATLQDARAKELEKKAKAQGDVSLTSEGAGSGAVSASEKDAAKEIAGAKPQW